MAARRRFSGRRPQRRQRKLIWVRSAGEVLIGINSAQTLLDCINLTQTGLPGIERGWTLIGGTVELAIATTSDNTSISTIGVIVFKVDRTQSANVGEPTTFQQEDVLQAFYGADMPQAGAAGDPPSYIGSQRHVMRIRSKRKLTTEDTIRIVGLWNVAQTTIFFRSSLLIQEM